ncbi:unnamed protein product [Parnassius mnemosyne]|uniref:Uncharacterized protein n=1 Tax=Parnassius mnemosyne TaxID=213953 RepID=A0AAV1LMY1_9NEOP
MTGQTKRKSSMVTLPSQSFDVSLSPPQSRKSSLVDGPSIDYTHKFGSPVTDDGVDDSVEELIKYSARKFSIFVPIKIGKDEATILDDADYFMSKKECDYGMCQCCHTKKKLQTDWETIEEIIENDPEIIFDSDDNPIVVEPKNDLLDEPKNDLLKNDSLVSPTILGNGVSLRKTMQLGKVPEIFKHICSKLSDTSLN